MDLTDINRILHSVAAEHMLLKCIQNVPQDDHVLQLRTSLNEFKKIEVISGIFSSHSGKKLEISNSRKTGKFITMWILKQKAPEQPVGQRIIKGIAKNILKQMKMRAQHIKT